MRAQTLQCQICYRTMWREHVDTHKMQLLCMEDTKLGRQVQRILDLAIDPPVKREKTDFCPWCNDTHLEGCTISLEQYREKLTAFYYVVYRSPFQHLLPPTQASLDRRPLNWTLEYTPSEMVTLINRLFGIWVCITQPQVRFRPHPPQSLKDPFLWKHITPAQWDLALPVCIQTKLVVFDPTFKNLSPIYIQSVCQLLFRHPDNIRLQWDGSEYYARQKREWKMCQIQDVSSVLAENLTRFMMDPQVLTRKRDVALGYYSLVFQVCKQTIESEHFKKLVCRNSTQEFRPWINARTFAPSFKQEEVLSAKNLVEFTKTQQTATQTRLAQKTRVLHQQVLLAPTRRPIVPKRPKFIA